VNEPRWICREECLVLHDMMLARHCGLAGIRDEALLDATLAKPRERFAAGSANLPDFAACYAKAIVDANPFASGNACTGFLLATTFLRINGLAFSGRDVPTVEETLALGRGDSSESFYAFFLKCNSRAV
jgi:death-on-curing protein